MARPSKIPNLQVLTDQVKEALASGSFIVDAKRFSSPIIAHFFSLLEGVDKFPLKNLQVTESDTGLSISGTASLMNQDLVQTQLDFFEYEEQLVVNALLEMPPEAIQELPGAKDFPVQQIRMYFETDTEQERIKSFLKGQLQIGDSTIPVMILFPDAQEGDWLLSADLESATSISLTHKDLKKLVGNTDILKIIPKEIADFGSLVISDVKMAFNPKESRFSSLYVLFDHQEKWEPFSGKLSIQDLSLAFTVEHPLNKKKRTILGTGQGSSTLQEVSLDVSAEFPSGVFLGALREGDQIELTKVIQHFLPEAQGLPETHITQLSMQGDLNESVLNVEMGVDNVWKQSLGPVDMAINNLHANIEWNESGGNGGMTGSYRLLDTDISLSAALTDSFQFEGILPEISLTTILANFFPNQQVPLGGFDLSFSDVQFTATPSQGEFSLSGISQNDWTIPIGIAGIEMNDIGFEITRQKTGNKTYQTTGYVGGVAQIGNASFDLRYNFPGDFILKAHLPSINLSGVVQDLCGAASVVGLPTPPHIMNAEFTHVLITVAPQQKYFSLSGATEFGEGEVQVKKTSTGKWGFIVGFAPPESFPFSKIDASLAVLDDLKFSNGAFIISAARDASLNLSIVETPPSGVPISPGLNFFASLDMTGLGVDDLMGIKSLYINAAIGNRPTNLVIEAGIGGSFPIGENVSFGDMRFRLQPAPTNFALGIRGAITAKLNEDVLVFIGGMEIRPLERTAAFQAMMKGTWNEPFGFQGVALSDVAADIGLTIVPPPSTPLPVIGLAGSLRVGSFSGSAAVRFDSAVPTKSMLAVAFNRLFLKDVIQTFCEPQVYQAIPADIRNTVLDVGMEDVDVYIVPQPTQIVDLYYDQGFTIKGRITIAGFNAYAHLNLDYTKGILVEAEMDVIEIAGLFKLAGSKDKAKPMLKLDLRIGEKPGLEIAGSVFLLGLQAETRVSLTDTAFYFWISGKIFDLFEASIEARGGDFQRGGDFYLKVTMRNDLFAYLREEATKAIRAAAEEATRELTEAQRKLTLAQGEVDKLNRDIDHMRAIIRRERERDERNVRNARKEVENAQREVNRLNGEINRMRGIVRAERERDERNVRNARNEVANARNKVNGLQTQMNHMRNTIRQERARDTARIQAAEREVGNAQNKVNGIQSEINSSHRRIRTLNDQIKAKKRWFDNKPWYDKTWAWAEYSAYAAAKGAEITGLYTKIGGLEAAKHTAIGVLEAAKQVLRGIRAAADTFPIDADPRMVGLISAHGAANGVLRAAEATLRQLEKTIKGFPIDADVRVAGLITARTAAQGALKLAQETLRALEKTIKNFPIDADVRIAGLFTARDGAKGALELAKLSLEGLKASIGAVAEVGEFIARVGLGGLLDVRAASFEGNLTTVNGGSVSLSATVVFMGEESRLSFAFNFHSPLAGAKALAEKLLPG